MERQEAPGLENNGPGLGWEARDISGGMVGADRAHRKSSMAKPCLSPRAHFCDFASCLSAL